MYLIAYIATHDQCLIVAVHIRVLTKGGRGLPEIGQYMYSNSFDRLYIIKKSNQSAITFLYDL